MHQKLAEMNKKFDDARSKATARDLQLLKDNNPKLIALYLAMRQLDLNIQDFLAAFPTNSHVTFLDISDNRISKEGLAILVTSRYLISLNINNNAVGDAGALALAASSRLLSLKAKKNQIGLIGAKAFAMNTTLTELNLGANSIKDEGAKIMAQNTRLTALGVSASELGMPGLLALADNTRLMHLNVSLNRLQNTGANILAKKKNLISLKAAHCEIGDEGAKGLANNSYLIRLDLSFNAIRSLSSSVFVENLNLRDLDLLANPLEANVQNQIRRAIKDNTKARELLFVEQVVEIAKGCRPSQNLLLGTLPTDLWLLIFFHLAAQLGLKRTPEELTNACRFLMTTVRMTTETTLNWRTRNKSGFFRAWNNPNRYQELKERYLKICAPTTLKPEETTSSWRIPGCFTS